MSIESTWDLLSSEQPRSLCVFAARDSSSLSSAASSSNNPFDAAVSEASSHVIAVIFGTEQGSLHYRTFAPNLRRHNGAPSSPLASHSRNNKPVQNPLGSLQNAASNSGDALPRSFYPVDLAPQKLPGSIVTIRQMAPHVFLLLVDDQPDKSTESAAIAAPTKSNQYWAAHLASLEQGHWKILTMPAPAGASQTKLGSAAKTMNNLLPRMSAAVWHKATGLVYTAGRNLATFSVGNNHNSKLAAELQSMSTLFWPQDVSGNPHSRGAFASAGSSKRYTFQATLPAPGARSGADSLALTANGQVAVCAVGTAFYAVAGAEVSTTMYNHYVEGPPSSKQVSSTSECVKVLSFSQSSQVYPVIVLDIPDLTLDPDWSLVFLANGRDCAVVDLFYTYSSPRVSCSKPRNGTVTCASPILAAATSWPWVAILASDGLVSIRSPSCLAVSLRTVEIGRPNDYFCLRTLTDEGHSSIVAASYSGAGKVLQCHADTAQDLSDRLMRLAIDAFGASGFPRVELAEAIHSSFTATSYVGPEPNQQARLLLQQYLEAVLGLTDFASGGKSGWPTEIAQNTLNDVHHGSLTSLTRSTSGRGVVVPNVTSVASPDALLVGSALLCLVCMQVSPPQSNLASRAAISCAEKLGIVIQDSATYVSAAAQVVCEMVADKMLKESSSLFTLVSGSSPTPIARGPKTTQASMYTDIVEAAIWLLRACGKHERAFEIAYDKLHRGQPDSTSASTRGTWSKIKYESYTATHLSELWTSGKEGHKLVIDSPATRRLLEVNPGLGLSIFTTVHPQNELQWRSLRATDDPLARPDEVKLVIELLSSVVPSMSTQSDGPTNDKLMLPLETSRALVVTFLESAIGVESARPPDDEYDFLPIDAKLQKLISDFHDELAFLLLEGVIVERRDDDSERDKSDLGKLYHAKLLKLLRWPPAKFRAERLLETIPSTFLHEKALLFGRMGRHEDALRILYRDLQNLDLALAYCDDRFGRHKARHDANVSRRNDSTVHDDDRFQEVNVEDNPYLPLVRVALESEDTGKGITAAIQVLALRRGAIDRAAALRLLPSNVPVSAVARPFLIPALVDSESQVRRLTVMSALLRARYLRLKDQLTTAQLQAQSNLHTVPQLKTLNLGEPLHSTNPFRARTSSLGSNSSMPDVMIIKHFFHRFLVVQAKITNSVGLSNKVARSLADIAFVVAESSDDAIQPLIQVPIQRLPPSMTGYAWCVLSADASRMEGPTAQLTCELRYTVLSVEASSSLMASPQSSGGSTFVEELQDLEVNSAHFV
ncbi:hypothetical protein MPSEU_000604700 [Mayamaea pseudoterrestris]|nr:hypothetical protein MPSEU_000604700 [Mayamaea pseudoterrestris]